MNDGDNRLAVLTFTPPTGAGFHNPSKKCECLPGFDSILGYAKLQGLTGGTLDVYLQAWNGQRWIDILHFPQLAAGAAAVEYAFSLGKHTAGNAIKVVGSDSTPALAVNQVVGGDFGLSIRAVAVVGAGVSAAVAQIIELYFSS